MVFFSEIQKLGIEQGQIEGVVIELSFRDSRSKKEHVSEVKLKENVPLNLKSVFRVGGMHYACRVSVKVNGREYSGKSASSFF